MTPKLHVGFMPWPPAQYTSYHFQGAMNHKVICIATLGIGLTISRPLRGQLSMHAGRHTFLVTAFFILPEA